MIKDLLVLVSLNIFMLVSLGSGIVNSEPLWIQVSIGILGFFLILVLNIMIYMGKNERGIKGYFRYFFPN